MNQRARLAITISGGAEGSADRVHQRLRIADELYQALPEFGFAVADIDVDDMARGVRIELANAGPCVLFIDVVDDPKHSDRVLAWVSPPTPYIRSWFRRVPTETLVRRLGWSTVSILSKSALCGKAVWIEGPER